MRSDALGRGRVQRGRVLHQRANGRIRAESRVEFVPFNLVRHQGGDHVVDIRRAGDVNRQRAPPVVVPLTPPRWRLNREPVVQWATKCLREVLGKLAEHDA